jgi:enoyl-CoA hydratase
MELVHLTVDGPLATVTLDSPHNRNALSAQLVAELTAHLATVRDDPSVRAMLLTHTGRTFCAGADLTEADRMAEGTERLLALLRDLVELPKPVICRVDGHVRAGGIGLVGACDIVAAGPSATFAFTEARLGLAPAVICLTTLPRMAERAAGRYFLTGETFGGAEAVACGLVTVAGDDVDALLAPILDGVRAGSPQGLAASKALAASRVRRMLEEEGPRMAKLSADLFASDEARSRMAAFLERRS